MGQSQELTEDEYDVNIIQTGNRISKTLLMFCKAANDSTYAARKGILNTDTWEINVTEDTWIKTISLQTDWTGTKAEIYCNAFESLFKENEDQLESVQWKLNGLEQWDQFIYENIKEISAFKDFFSESVEIWELMLMDLVAMNVDDFKKGELWVVMSNIIDINALDWIRGVVFEGTFWIALKNVITKTWIAITAWETAWLWHPPSTRRLNSLTNETLSGIEAVVWEKGLEKIDVFFWKVEELGMSQEDLVKLLEEWGVDKNSEYGEKLYNILLGLTKIVELSDKGRELVRWQKGDVSWLLDNHKEQAKEILDTMYFNLAGSAIWILGEDNKLEEWWVQEGDVIIALTETKSKDWIIWPRANGFTAIRQSLIDLAWEGWEGMNYTDFIGGLPQNIQSKLAQVFWDKYDHLPMWKIATGSSTSFNMLIADKMLWWIDWDKKVKLSWMAHMTGGPGIKLLDSLDWNESIQANVDLSDIGIPDIIQILQVITWESDKNAMKKWNMWCPFVLYCRPWEEEETMNIINDNEFSGEIVWNVVKREEWKPSVQLKWVWMWKSNVTYTQQKAA